MKEFSQLRDLLSAYDYDKELTDDMSIRRALQLREKSPKFFLVDLSTNQAFVSDALRDLMGFETNVVEGFPQEIARRISHPIDRELFEMYLQEDANLQELPESYSRDVYYRMKMPDGKQQWLFQNTIIIPNFDNLKASLFVGTITKLNSLYLLNHSRGQMTHDRLNQDLVELVNEHPDHAAVCFQLPMFTSEKQPVTERRQDLLLIRFGLLFNELFGETHCYRLKDQLYCAFVPDFGQEKAAMMQAVNRLIHTLCIKLSVDAVSPCCEKNVFVRRDRMQGALLGDILNFIEEQPELNATYSEAIGETDQFTMRETLNIVNSIQDNFAGFKYVVQPAWDTRAGRFTIAEILLRSQDAKQGVSPGQFVQMLEGSRMIVPFARHSFDQAVGLMAKMKAKGIDFTLAVNFSPMMLKDEKAFDYIKQSLDHYELDGSHFFLEFTETAIDKYPHRTAMFLQQCQTLGFHIAIDDFGEGANTLLKLFETPCEVVKLSRNLALQATNDPARRIFIEQFIHACQVFGKRVCIEGIEDEAMLKVFEGIGADFYQGYYFYRPIDFDELINVASQKKHEGQ